MVFLCPSFYAAIAVFRYGVVIWAAFALAAPIRGISTPLNHVAQIVEIMGGVSQSQNRNTAMTNQTTQGESHTKFQPITRHICLGDTNNIFGLMDDMQQSVARIKAICSVMSIADCHGELGNNEAWRIAEVIENEAGDIQAIIDVFFASQDTKQSDPLETLNTGGVQ